MPAAKVDDPFSEDRLNDADDFRPEWDVPTLGKRFTDDFSAAIDQVRAHPRADPKPDPKLKIHAFVGPAGYGKTHLFGRLRHRHGDRVYLAFLGAPPAVEGDDKQRLLETALRWRLVEALLYSSRSVAPFRLALARLLVPSFAAYFDQLAPGLRAKCAAVRHGLSEDPLTVLEVFGHVDALGPYHELADALRAALPHCSGPVVRALVLSASPAGDDVRWWLRGEADQIPDHQLAALRLTDRDAQPLDSPPLVEVLKATAELLRLSNVPLVLCFDQLEELFKSDRAGFVLLTGQLMAWLQTVPNLLIGIGCLEATWKEVKAEAAFASFVGRVSEHNLPPLSGAEAVELVERRLKSWVDFDPRQPAGVPFDLDSVRAYAEKHRPSPRHFIQKECAAGFINWLSRKRQGLITVGGGGEVASTADLFKQEWTRTLEAVRAAQKSATDMPDTELWAAVHEALVLAEKGGFRAADFRIDKIHPQPLAQTPNDQRLSARIAMVAGGKSGSVVVAVSKKDNGVAFGNWYSALDAAMTGPVLGAVVVRPRAKLTVGARAAAYLKYAKRLESGTVRPFPLDEQEGTLHQLECLRQVTSRAGGDLILNGAPVSKEECHKLILQTGLLSNLKLYEFLFLNWKGLDVSPSPPTAAPPPAPPAAPPAPPAPAPAPVPEPLSVATPAPPLPPPPAEPSWADVILKKAADYLKRKGEAVHPLGTEVGPTFVRLKLELRGDADFNRVRRQAENLKVHLALAHEPLISSQAGYVSVDVQRPDRQTVFLPPLLAACPPSFAGEPVVPAGVSVSGTVEWLNLSEPESCHLLVAGTTGSGKSEFLKAVLASLAARLEPAKLRFRLVDPKRVTFNVDGRCPYLSGPVVYDGEEAIPVLEECVEEMERRYKLLQKRGADHVRQLTGADAVPRWVVVFDEFADLMVDRATKNVLEPLLKRLGAKARAAGIHLVLGTQRPEASVVTPLLRSNLPGRIGLQVASEKESKLFLDEPDAAYLFGKGDLVWKRGGGLVRLQSPFVPKAEFDAYLRTR
ncbi:FtsK/SpoIIIE domain-containing protein [Gemmata sp.]|uniref:FtsK/SpoIIIE domain-containing protein n=1 Tax=Gemmata sp. TaxID=1914242 RepID=UPI003F6F1439